MNINKSLDFADLKSPDLAPTRRDIQRWTRRWFLSGTPLGVNGGVRHRFYIRGHKLWEYTHGLARTRTSRPRRDTTKHLHILDVGGAMTLPVFYPASLGDRVVCLDIHQQMTDQTNAIARKKNLPVDARTTDLTTESPSPHDLGVPAENNGFDRVFCFCVIEHVLPPAQHELARRMGELLRPGGLMCLTFDYGEHAPTEAPMYNMDHVRALQDAVALPLVGNQPFEDDGKRYPLNKRHPGKQYTFGSMFFTKPTD